MYPIINHIFTLSYLNVIKTIFDVISMRITDWYRILSKKS